jgi:hypothetical protein
MVVTGISIDNAAVRNYSAWALNLTTGIFSWITVGTGGQLSLYPQEQVNILIDAAANLPAANTSSFYDNSTAIPVGAFLKIELFTALQNDFTRVFIPPTAVALVTPLETFSAGNYTTVPILDGSNSYQSGNATIIEWNWSVTPLPSGSTIHLSGERVADDSTVAGKTYAVVLIVTNSDGLFSLPNTVDYTA